MLPCAIVLVLDIYVFKVIDQAQPPALLGTQEWRHGPLGTRFPQAQGPTHPPSALMSLFSPTFLLGGISHLPEMHQKLCLQWSPASS